MQAGDAQRAAARYTRLTMRVWEVADSPAPTATTWGLADENGVPVAMGATALGLMVGGVVEFVSGAQAGNPALTPPTPVNQVAVTGTGTGGNPTTVTVTVEAGLSAAPAAGDRFVVLSPATVDAEITGATVMLPTDLQAVYQPAADSSVTALGAAATYATAAPYIATGNVRRIVGTVISDQAGTLYVQQSPDGGNDWDVQTAVAVSAGDAAGAGTAFSVEVVAPTTRLYYVNGATAQAVFRLYAWVSPS